ncbi:MAG: PEP-CTERM sorting domain-containing protein [Limisphaerales bacterium]
MKATTQKVVLPLSVALALITSISSSQAQAVFTSNFDGTIPPEISPGTALITGVQGYAGLGPAGNQFGGSFLRSETANPVTLQLNGLPAHTAVNVAFLFAAIDSLDGTGTFPQGDFFHVTLDGLTIFNESFANATSGQIQSYVPPPGVELARRVDLGFNGPGGFFTDSAYDLGADPVFSNIPHTASSLTLRFLIEGGGIQSLSDESWAMDNLKVTIVPPAAPTLTITRSGTNVVITWPTTFTGFTLEGTPTLSPPIIWTTIPSTVNGTNNTATVIAGSGNQFFRLRK